MMIVAMVGAEEIPVTMAIGIVEIRIVPIGIAAIPDDPIGIATMAIVRRRVRLRVPEAVRKATATRQVLVATRQVLAEVHRVPAAAHRIPAQAIPALETILPQVLRRQVEHRRQEAARLVLEPARPAVAATGVVEVAKVAATELAVADTVTAAAVIGEVRVVRVPRTDLYI